MCRWLAFISDEPMLLEDLLINAPHPITQEVHDHYIPGIVRTLDFDERNAPYNLDGFGITWYTKTRSEFDDSVRGPYPALYKTTSIPITDATFNFVCGNTASKCIFAHVRAATRPPVASTNNHPFIFGRHSFMQNGGIANFTDIRLEMLKETSAKYGAMIHGNTDSEHLAALYFTYLGDVDRQYPVEHMKDSMKKAVEFVRDTQIRMLGKEVANSMNLCATDGESLVALRYRNHPTEDPPSLYVSFTAAASLNRKHNDEWNANQNTTSAEHLVKNARHASEVHGQEDMYNPHGYHVIVASEPVTFVEGQWLLLKKGEFLMIGKKRSNETEDKGTNLRNDASEEMEVTFDQLKI